MSRHVLKEGRITNDVKTYEPPQSRHLKLEQQPLDCYFAHFHTNSKCHTGGRAGSSAVMNMTILRWLVASTRFGNVLL